VPAQASTGNQLADKEFVNSSIQNMAAMPVYADASQSLFATRAALLAATVFYDAAGEEYTPTENDYAVVLADEGAPAPFTGGQTKFFYKGGVWAYEYGINETPFTASQNAALNSGITAELVEKLEDIPDDGVNVQADWAETDTDDPSYIQNKPGVATSSTDGLLSAADKAKLDTISNVANRPEVSLPALAATKIDAGGNVQFLLDGGQGDSYPHTALLACHGDRGSSLG